METHRTSILYHTLDGITSTTYITTQPASPDGAPVFLVAFNTLGYTHMFAAPCLVMRVRR